MCLEAVTEYIDAPTTKVVIGYKKFRSYRDTISHRKEYHFQYKDLNGSIRVPRGRWVTAEPISLPGVLYKIGFHAYKKYDVLGARGTKVLLRRVSTVGRQSGCLCLVADEMFVPSSFQEIR